MLSAFGFGSFKNEVYTLYLACVWVSRFRDEHTFYLALLGSHASVRTKFIHCIKRVFRLSRTKVLSALRSYALRTKKINVFGRFWARTVGMQPSFIVVPIEKSINTCSGVCNGVLIGTIGTIGANGTNRQIVLARSIGITVRPL